MTTVLVAPGAELTARRRLFDALGDAFDVRFEAAQGRAGAEVAGVVHFGDRGEHAGPLGAPRFVAPLGAAARGPAVPVTFADGPPVDARLRGRTMSESAVAPSLADLGPDEVVAARGPHGPLWTCANGTHRVALGPEELEDGERLKDRMRAGRFLGLLPLVHFLREVTGYHGSTPPPTTAVLVVDDPNLHWPSYGYVCFERLAGDAEAHGYHVAIGMPAIDGRFAHPSAAATIASSPRLSLLVHGNDHVKHELARPVTLPEARAVVAQALRRAARFEARYGVAVERVVVPPHSACSQLFMTAMRQLGCDGVLYRGPAASPDALVGWRAADVHLGGGLPGVHRVPLDVHDDELVLRALLDQPLVLYGHHGDLEDPGALTTAAARVDRVGPVTWCSAGEIVMGNVTTARDGSLLRVTPFSRSLRVTVATEVAEVLVEARMAGRPDDTVEVDTRGSVRQEPIGAAFPVDPVDGRTDLRMRLVSADEMDPATVAPPRWTPWPVLRRCLTEARDRVRPLVRR